MVPQLEQLMGRGEDNNGRSPQWQGGTALHYQAKQAHSWASEGQNPLIWLVENGADISALDSEGHTAPIPISSARTITHRCISPSGLLRTRSSICSTTRLTPTFPCRHSLLHIAAWEAQVDLVRLHLKSGANINAVDNYNGTAVHEVVCFRGVNRRQDDYVETLRVLLDAGLDPEARMVTGYTPLFRACYNGHLGMVKLLLERGADPNAKLANEDEGSTLTDVAAAKGHKEIAALSRGVNKST
ncbi:ankyrin repeat-containing domain protein [Dactylonectria macrodidyma]|uniref:Ankyrin repeat-containing domain protein n=1 Tax=Dactylonectria macrodidyma TaxID=307937 RepID=A0A9P9JM80_9HYPO|nr:ankyrin repeat-containing domain protein [Dactylonectria macrodidyma]